MNYFAAGDRVAPKKYREHFFLNRPYMQVILVKHLLCLVDERFGYGKTDIERTWVHCNHIRLET